MTINIRSRYRSSSDISMRHNDTHVGVIQRDGTVTPYYCNGAASNSSLSLSKCEGNYPGPQHVELDLNDEHLIIDRPNCGFANLQDGNGKEVAVYFATRALRQYKRSLVFGHLRSSVAGGDVSGLGFGGINRSRALYQFFNDCYPSVSDAVVAIKEDRASSLAISSKFALAKHDEKGIVLYYKDFVVGWFDLQEEVLNLVPAMVHLQEQLDEVV